MTKTQLADQLNRTTLLFMDWFVLLTSITARSFYLFLMRSSILLVVSITALVFWLTSQLISIGYSSLHVAFLNKN